MNLLGKIFVFATMVMSLLFMAGAVMVYGTHRNWKDEIFRTEARGNLGKGWKSKVEDAKKENEKLTTEKDELQKTLDTEKAATRQTLAKLQTALQEKTTELASATTDRDKLSEEKRALTELLAVAQQSLKGVTDEVNTLRNQIRTVQQESDTKAKQVVESTEKNNQLTGDLTREKERSGQLVEQLATAKLLLGKVGMTLSTPLDLEPPKVDGVVLAIGGAQNNSLEISLGSDDGLRVGHTIDVYRNGKYLGRAQIVQIKSDRAVATVDSKILQGPIQKGDRVTTRLKA
ncbi:MAG TPA: hypothetical protein VFE24_10325 [Pirellulales bacterium]|jgi:uncharacterized protein YlxW (UPF0749 family)|nr:hypothetical protein [Pirellulales bacterium]